MRNKEPRRKMTREMWKDNIPMFVMFAPFAIAFLIFTVIPIIIEFYFIRYDFCTPICGSG